VGVAVAMGRWGLLAVVAACLTEPTQPLSLPAANVLQLSIACFVAFWCYSWTKRVHSAEDHTQAELICNVRQAAHLHKLHIPLHRPLHCRVRQVAAPGTRVQHTVCSGYGCEVCGESVWQTSDSEHLARCNPLYAWHTVHMLIPDSNAPAVLVFLVLVLVWSTSYPQPLAALYSIPAHVMLLRFSKAASGVRLRSARLVAPVVSSCRVVAPRLPAFTPVAAPRSPFSARRVPMSTATQSAAPAVEQAEVAATNPLLSVSCMIKHC
jgi:hypothetical protein